MMDNEIVFKVKANPIFWYQKAEELKYASELIWPHTVERLEKITNGTNLKELEPDISSIYLSLIGYSIECLFKSIIIIDNPSFVSNGVLSKKLRGHDLVKLAEMAKYSLSKHERIFCRQMYKAIMFESRYPIPLEADSFNELTELEGNCKEVFESLFNKLIKNRFQNKIS